jgi:hypothetical protein
MAFIYNLYYYFTNFIISILNNTVILLLLFVNQYILFYETAYL